MILVIERYELWIIIALLVGIIALILLYKFALDDMLERNERMFEKVERERQLLHDEKVRLIEFIDGIEEAEEDD